MNRAATSLPPRISLQMIIITAVATFIATLALMALSYGRGQASDNDLSPAVVVHLASVLPALPIGAIILYGKKGTQRHRLLGRIWVVLMLTASISSFWFSLSFIHLFSVLVLVSVPYSLWRIRNGDMIGHRRSMEGMYIGLVIAGAFAFIPGRFLGSLVFG